MTVSEFYDNIKGDYEEISSRVLSDERIRKYLYIFLQDKTFTKLCTELDNQSPENAFIYAHTLKGISQNLSLSPLFVQAELITQALRNNNLKKATSVLPELSKEYARVILAIENLKEAEYLNKQNV